MSLRVDCGKTSLEQLRTVPRHDNCGHTYHLRRPRLAKTSKIFPVALSLEASFAEDEPWPLLHVKRDGAAAELRDPASADNARFATPATATAKAPPSRTQQIRRSDSLGSFRTYSTQVRRRAGLRPGSSCRKSDQRPRAEDGVLCLRSALRSYNIDLAQLRQDLFRL